MKIKKAPGKEQNGELIITLHLGELWTIFNAYDHATENLHPVGKKCYETVKTFLESEGLL